MKLLFTTSGKIGSKLIRWGTGCDCSHFAVSFDEGPTSGIVFHSHLEGVNIAPYPWFIQQNKVIHSLSPIAAMDEEAIYQKMVNMFYGKPYDKLAFTYFAWSALKHKLFGSPWPVTNPWGESNAYLCTEIAAALADVPCVGLKSRDFGAVFPHELWGMFPQSVWSKDIVL